jgi:hypothetical protein
MRQIVLALDPGMQVPPFNQPCEVQPHIDFFQVQTWMKRRSSAMELIQRLRCAKDAFPVQWCECNLRIMQYIARLVFTDQ